MTPTENNKRVLLTGASGFIGHYLTKAFDDMGVIELQRHTKTGIICDLMKQIPRIDRYFEIVIHAAGTCDDTNAIQLNYEGTKKLLEALEHFPPKTFVYISCTDVYGKTEGEMIDENTTLRPISEYGRSKVLAEKEVTEWCQSHATDCIILRPAMPFGNGVHGLPASIYSRVAAGRYLLIRENEAQISTVCAYDIARAARSLLNFPGIYNITDGRHHTFASLINAMAANGGKNKRVLVAPLKLARKIAFIGSILPGLGLPLNKKLLSEQLTTLTYSSAKVEALLSFEFYDTISVIARKNESYPYEYAIPE